MNSEGGKAAGLRALETLGFRVPEWFVIPSEVLSGGAHQEEAVTLLEAELKRRRWESTPLAVRSSALDEDGASQSFAGQYESVLGVVGTASARAALERCRESASSSRVAEYRRAQGLAPGASGIAVIVQKLIDPIASGVAFSRDPLSPVRGHRVLINSVFGLGEALVSGQEPADSFTVNIENSEVLSEPVEKRVRLRRSSTGGHALSAEALAPAERSMPSLSQAQAREIAEVAVKLEAGLGRPVDLEWAIDSSGLHLLQARPIASLPRLAFFDPEINGRDLKLWDNSNIIESYRGVTTPLTFSHVSRAYTLVYIQYCRLMGVPERVIEEHEPVFRNMLGLIRGRVYYNLVNWYRMTFLFPGAKVNAQFMETMMGVKRSLGEEGQALLMSVQRRRGYSAWNGLKLLVVGLYRTLRVRKLVRDFDRIVGEAFREAERLPFSRMPLPALVETYQRLMREIVGNWQAPIVNDVRCMIFFGGLQKLTRKWLNPSGSPELMTLHNDLLSGEAELESTEPTRRLMRLAALVREIGGELERRFLAEDPAEIWKELDRTGEPSRFVRDFREYLALYGYRSPNELKLEEKDLHDDPSFALGTIAGYLRSTRVSIAAMEAREKELRARALALVRSKLHGPRRWMFFFVLRSARAAVRDREKLRLMRTRTFGMLKRLFRAMGQRLQAMGKLENASQVFYLSIDEIVAYAEGRAITSDLEGIAALRMKEFESYKKTLDPPERFHTTGTVGLHLEYPVLVAATEQKSEPVGPDDGKSLYGIPCCPGVVEGRVRVARTVEDAKGIQGEILVTETTDPGWVPIFPLCSALLVERGSLLSHSAVVAREFGVPTIVGVRGGLLQRLKTGQRVRMDGSTGRIEILDEDSSS